MDVRMAQQVNVKFVDDLDGSDAAGTVSFGLDGRAYEIDLSDDNAARLRDSLAAFIAAARKSGAASATGGRRTPKMTATSGPRPQPLDREQTAAIRAWARQNGHQISDRGRIPKTVVDAFQAAHCPTPQHRHNDGVGAESSDPPSVLTAKSRRLRQAESRDQVVVSCGSAGSRSASRSARTAVATRCTVSAAARSTRGSPQLQSATYSTVEELMSMPKAASTT
jgi:hypothetical protein